MRMILHDYADDVGVQILARLAAAMALDSRVLICEMMLPQRVGGGRISCRRHGPGRHVHGWQGASRAFKHARCREAGACQGNLSTCIEL